MSETIRVVSRDGGERFLHGEEELKVLCAKNFVGTKLRVVRNGRIIARTHKTIGSYADPTTCGYSCFQFREFKPEDPENEEEDLGFSEDPYTMEAFHFKPGDELVFE